MSFVGKPITCKAAVAWEAKKPLTIEEVVVAPPRAGEVRIHIKATGICHTDAYVLSGQDHEAVFPTILGHEGAGIVESVGEGVTSVVPGDHVIPLYVPECRKCKMCLSGKTNLCKTTFDTQFKGLMMDNTSRFTCKGKTIYHFMGTSTFSEYTVVNEINCAKVAKHARLDRVCLLGCGIPTGWGAVNACAKVEPGSTVAVFGCGAIGLSAIQGAAYAKCKKVVAIDINNAKCDIAKKFGATDFINPLDYPDTPIQKVIADKFDGGVDYSVECSGGNVNVMRSALECCHDGWGTSVIISLAASDKVISTKPLQLVFGRVWKGCYFGGVKGRTDIPTYVDLYDQGKLLIDEYVSLEYVLDEINQGFNDLRDAKCLRPVVKFQKE